MSESKKKDSPSREAILTFVNDLKFAIRSLGRSKGLVITVVLTLALGIGANAAIFTLVRGVLLRPLVNRDEDRLIYIQQSAPGISPGGVPFSVPEIQDLRASVKTLGSFGDRSATIIGVLEPSVQYPTNTEIIANIVTSPHHLSATMQNGRVHRMTELFGKLTPGATLESARAELRAVHGAMVKAHPAEYPAQADFRIEARLLRDQITSRAKTVLLVLLAASALIFVIACSNVANLILSRTVRREGELSIRAALGATTGALRRVLLAESLLLCGAGATLGVLSARPMVDIMARYASRFSVRALDLTVDSSMLWVGAALAVVAAVLLAFVPRLPSADSSQGISLSNGSVRITGSTNRRLRIFAVTQIAASFVLLAGASALVKTLLSLQAEQTGLDIRHVLAIHVS